MDQKHQTITLYTAQTPPVLAAIEKDGFCLNKERYIREKYGGVSSVFLTVYRQFVRSASAILPPPEGAEFAYWAFRNPRDMFVGDTSRVLTLDVPAEQVLLFDVYDWNKMLQFRYLGEDPADEAAFQRELEKRGVTSYEVVSSSFYPDLKQKILASWPRLLRHHRALLAGDDTGVQAVQAGLWQIRREWVRQEAHPSAEG